MSGASALRDLTVSTSLLLPVLRVEPNRNPTREARESKTNSDNGCSYYSIKENTPSFPRVDGSTPLKDRRIYRLEVWCRYTGCFCQSQKSPETLQG
ncbi:hypothetical protein BJX76DRAFT_360006 [Aspergillus varians]